MTTFFVLLSWTALTLSLTTCGAHAVGRDQPQVPQIVADSNAATRAPRNALIEFAPELILKSPSAKPRVLDSKKDYVDNGDTIEAFITPAENVFVYLGYCSGNEFALYPAEGRSLLAEARQKFKIPEPYDIYDDKVLYVIVSRTVVSLASPDLAIAIAQSRRLMGRRALDDDCAGGPADVADSQRSSLTPINVRPPETAISVVRYEFLRRPQPGAR
jgi:hypothetical protein